MKKSIILLFFFVMAVSMLFAADESLTITTYYPSPFGSYNSLSANRLSVGTTNTASNNGVIRFNPVDPAAAGNRGEIYYDNSENVFKYQDNTAGWKDFGTGSQVASGSFTGTNTANTQINVGFQPTAVFVQRDANGRHMKIQGMGTTSFGPNGGTSNTCITGFYAQGFVVGTDNTCNGLGQTIYYIAYRD